MDTLTFIAKFVESAAWPLVVLVIFLVLRKEIVRSIPRLQRLKFKDAELEFQQKAQEIESALPKTFEGAATATEVEEKLKFLAQMSPRLAIIEAWSQIEFALGQYASAQRLVTPEENVRANVAYHEVAKQVLGADEELFKRYHDLRQLRNKAVHDHGYEPSSDNAYAFAVLAARLIGVIESRASAA
jgi:hypothetical protein